MPKVSLKAHALVALMLAVLMAAAYAPILNLSFLNDDWVIVRVVSLPEGGWAMILGDLYSPFLNSAKAIYRPMYPLSFGIDYSLYGTNPLGYHLTNLALHLLCSFFVYLLALELVPGERRREIAITAGALFALHPIHPEVVTWISGRVGAVCAVFYLPSLLFFLRWQRTGRRLYLPLSLGAFALALASKEAAVVLLAILFLCALYRRRGDLTNALVSVLPFAAVLGVYLPFRAYIMSGLESMGIADRSLDVTETFWGFLYRTSHAFVPINLGLLPAKWESFVESLFFFLPILAVVALAAAYYRGWVVEKLPILLLALYAVALVPVATVLRPDPLLTTARWSYIPSAFLSILIAYVLWTAFAGRWWVSLAAASVVCAVFFGTLVANNGPWLVAGELAEEHLAWGEEPASYPLSYKGAYAFGNELSWVVANEMLSDEP